MKKNKNTNISEIARAARVADRDARLEAMRNGLRQTSHTFVDRKKQANRNACRACRG